MWRLYTHRTACTRSTRIESIRFKSAIFTLSRTQTVCGNPEGREIFFVWSESTSKNCEIKICYAPQRETQWGVCNNPMRPRQAENRRGYPHDEIYQATRRGGKNEWSKQVRVCKWWVCIECSVYVMIALQARVYEDPDFTTTLPCTRAIPCKSCINF